MQHKISARGAPKPAIQDLRCVHLSIHQDVERVLDRLGIVPPRSLQKADLDHPFDRLACR
jgi:hypothetical protein